MTLDALLQTIDRGFSALQRAEIAEMNSGRSTIRRASGFSALQRAEIAEIIPRPTLTLDEVEFQCSSTSRNC